MPRDTLLGFHNDDEVQAYYVDRMEGHYRADEIAQGLYWDGTAGCAVGCTLHRAAGEHERFESELGVPTALGVIQDHVFEILGTSGDARDFALGFITWIPKGADLSGVTRRFAAWMIDDHAVGLITSLSQYMPQSQQESATTCMLQFSAMLRSSHFDCDAANALVAEHQDILGRAVSALPFGLGALIETGDIEPLLNIWAYRRNLPWAHLAAEAASELLWLLADAPTPSGLPVGDDATSVRARVKTHRSPTRRAKRSIRGR